MKKNIKIGVKVTKLTCTNVKQTYQAKFLRKQSMHKRGDKAIYVRSEYHEKLMRIAGVIGGGKLPLYAYLDNIIKHHFELFEKEISEEFDAKNKPIF